MPVNETTRISRRLYSLLQDLVGGRCYDISVPVGTPFPYIVFAPIPGTPDTNGAAGARLLSRPLYTVKVIGRLGQGDNLDPLALQDIADAIDARLVGTVDDAPALVDGVLISRAVRETAISFSQPAQGDPDTVYWHVGGHYRLFVFEDET